MPIWRGKVGVKKEQVFTDYDEDYYLVKEELTHYGATKLILKDKKTGKIIEKVKE